MTSRRDERVEIRHPQIEGTGTSTRDALETVWCKRGWHAVDEATPTGGGHDQGESAEPTGDPEFTGPDAA